MTENETVKVTKEENFWLSIMRLNKLQNKKEINLTKTLWRTRIRFSWRSRKNLWGRFGGGWNWKLGFQMGDTTLIISLLIFSISIAIVKKAD